MNILKNNLLLLIMVCFLGCNSSTKQTVENISVADTVSNFAVVDSVSNAVVDSIYSKVQPERLKIASYPNFKISYAFKYDKLRYIIGQYVQTPEDLPKNDMEGLRLLVLDPNGKLVFRSLGSGDSYQMTATMYKLDNKSPKFILSEKGDESGSCGNAVFIVRNNVVEEIGYLDLGIPKQDESDPTPSIYFANIGDYTRIVKKGKTFHFVFEVDSVCLNPNSQKEIKLSGRDIRYVYDNHNFRLIKK